MKAAEPIDFIKIKVGVLSVTIEDKNFDWKKYPAFSEVIFVPESVQQHLRDENLDFANTITTMLNRNLSDDEHEKIRKQMDEYWKLQSETKGGNNG